MWLIRRLKYIRIWSRNHYAMNYAWYFKGKSIVFIKNYVIHASCNADLHHSHVILFWWHWLTTKFDLLTRPCILRELFYRLNPLVLLNLIIYVFVLYLYFFCIILYLKYYINFDIYFFIHIILIFMFILFFDNISYFNYYFYIIFIYFFRI